jgi:fatty-acyl-CoA synthase
MSRQGTSELLHRGLALGRRAGCGRAIGSALADPKPSSKPSSKPSKTSARRRRRRINNYRLHPRELHEVVAKTGPKAFVYGPEYAEHASYLRTHHQALSSYLRTGEVAAADNGAESFEAVVTQSSHDGPAWFAAGEGPSGEDILCLLGTGGTTGLPKAAMISHRMVAHNALTTMIHELVPGDVTVDAHTDVSYRRVAGLCAAAAAVGGHGGHPDAQVGRRGAAAASSSREQVTMFFCVPTQYQDLLDAPSFAKTSFASVRFVTSGGAPLPVPLVHAFRQIHDIPFKQGFGMTEFGPGCFSMGAEYAHSKAGSIGRPNALVGARVVDDDGQDLPTGQAGELLLKGPAMFSGYFEDEVATRSAIDASGWFHTGDIARIDADGFFFIVDRKKDMFISGGENVYPVEIERALYEHPAVKQCAVIGIPDEKWGQVGRAFVVLHSQPTTSVPAPSEDELLAFLRGKLARYKVPKSVRILTELPLSPAGKILKRSLSQT